LSYTYYLYVANNIKWLFIYFLNLLLRRIFFRIRFSPHYTGSFKYYEVFSITFYYRFQCKILVTVRPTRNKYTRDECTNTRNKGINENRISTESFLHRSVGWSVGQSVCLTIIVLYVGQTSIEIHIIPFICKNT